MSHLGQDGCRTKGRMGAAQWEGRCRTEGRMVLRRCRMGAALGAGRCRTSVQAETASFDFWKEIKIECLKLSELI